MSRSSFSRLLVWQILDLLSVPSLFSNQIGQGTYSNVYKARDTITGKIVALKKVRFDNLEPESVKFMAREILIQRRLDHPNVVKLEGLVTSRMSCSLYLVFEYMVHDLAGLATNPAIKFTESQVSANLPQLRSLVLFEIYDIIYDSRILFILWLLLEVDQFYMFVSGYFR